MLLLLVGACCNLSETVIRFFESPTHLTTLETTSTKMAFPSVMICPEIAYPADKVERFLANAKYPKGLSANRIRPLIQQLGAFYSPDVPYKLLDLRKVQWFLEYNDLDVEKAANRLTTTCDETLIRCRYLWRYVNCTFVFHQQVTLYGICCVFNGRSLKEELLYNIGIENKTKWTTSEVGPMASLMLAINQSQVISDVDLSYKWQIIQSSRHYVDTTNNGSALSPGVEHWSGFRSKHLIVAEDSQFLGDSLRGCRKDVKPLQYFPLYSRKYCLVECRMRKMIERCQCLLPVYHRPRGVPLCHPMSLPCAKKTLTQFNNDDCDCPSTCDHNTELTQSSTFDLFSRATPNDNFYDGLNFSEVTISRVYRISHESTTYIRRSYFGFHDLFSQLGGVFNVFFGCSILTLLELLQLAWHWYHDKITKTKPSPSGGLVAAPGKTITSEEKKKSVLLYKNGRVEKEKSKKKVSFLKLKRIKKLGLF